MKINILADSTCDLGMEILTEFNIDVIPLLVTVDGKEYMDGVEIEQEKLFSLVSHSGALPKTAAPSVGEFERFFSRDGENIFIGISSKLSATIESARLAGNGFRPGKVRIVDSLNLSTGIGLLVLRAAEMRDAGSSTQEIETEIHAMIPKVRTAFMIDTMDYLYKGGRCTALQAVAGSILNIHPVIEVRKDGTLGVKEKARGSRSRGLTLMLEDFFSHLDELDTRRVFVTHTTCPKDAEYIKGEILRVAKVDEVRITKAGSVISSHCGPGTIGILYCVK